MLILVVIALTIRDLTPSSERLLTRFMYVGALCFALALAANFFSAGGAYPLYFRVLPLDMGNPATRKLPMPIIKANNTELDQKMTYMVQSPVTAIVDVSDAIDVVGKLRSESERQREALTKIVASSKDVASDLEKVPAILDGNCPGGGSGISAASNPGVLAITNKAATTFTDFKATAVEAIGPGEARENR